MLISCCFSCVQAREIDQPDWLETSTAFWDVWSFTNSCTRQKYEVLLKSQLKLNPSKNQCIREHLVLVSPLCWFMPSPFHPLHGAQFYLSLNLIEANFCAALLFCFLLNAHVTFMCLFVLTGLKKSSFKTTKLWKNLLLSQFRIT